MGRESAQALADLDFRVFPIRANSKFPPLWTQWPERATTTPDAVTWPEHSNTGISCAGLVVVDIDVRSGGNESLAKLELMHSLPPTLTTLTPTGGRHLFFKLPPDHPGVGNSSGKLGPGLDIKSGAAGYVLAPGSELPGGRYRFKEDVPIADAPEWLIQRLGELRPRERHESVSVPDAPADVVERAREWVEARPVGGGQSYATACGLRDFGLSLDQAREVFAEHDPREDALAQVGHAYRYAQNAPGSKVASADDFPIVERAHKPRRKLLRLADLAQQSAGPYLVKGLLQKRSHAVMYGAPGEGKTFVALDIAYRVAMGLEWMGRKVRPGLVLYIAYEGIGGLTTRAAALIRQYQNADVPLYITGADYNLCEPAGRQTLAQDMAQLPAKPALIIIDTLARALHGDENSAQDMGNLNIAVSALIETTGACVLLIHHSGKNKANGARGSSALLGAIDTEIQVDSRQIFTCKQRDVEPAAPISFSLKSVPVGIDEDGDAVTSCVVEQAALTADRLANLSENARMAIAVLTEMAPDNEPVSADAWLATCRKVRDPEPRG